MHIYPMYIYNNFFDYNYHKIRVEFKKSSLFLIQTFLTQPLTTFDFIIFLSILCRY